MRIGVISDIHNNVVALNTVLDRLYAENCEQIICCGDIIGIGPYPEETVQHIMRIPNIVAVRGNHEKYLLEGMPEQVPNEEHMGFEEMEHHKWEHALLSYESIEFLRGLPYRNDFDLGGLHFIVMHYCMDSSNRYSSYTPHPDLENCYQMFSEVEADVILYGHDHNATVNWDEQKLYANFGSLGCPAKDGNVARAGILNINNEKVAFKTIKVLYDVDKVIEDINCLAYPAASEIKRYFFGLRE